MIKELAQFCRDYDLEIAKSDLEYALAIANDQGRISVCYMNGEIAGYVESWRLDFEQFGRIICKASFKLDEEDLRDGPIAYVANTAIHPSYRNSAVTKWLKDAFFKLNQDAEFFVGVANRKKHQPVKVFKNKNIREVINHEF